MTKGQLQLIGLVRLAMHPNDIGAIPLVLIQEDIDWNEIFGESQKQSLTGIAFVGIKRWLTLDSVNKASSPINKRLFIQWAGLCEKIKHDNLLLNKRTSQVCENLAKDGFRSTIMKGQGNALVYSEDLSLMRSSGDIDVWVEGGYHKVYEYVQKIAPTKRVNQMEMDFNVFSDAEVEVHYRPFILRHPLRNRRLKKFVKHYSEECFKNRVKLLTTDKDGKEIWREAVITTIPFNLVHQLAHIHLHLLTEGIGLRQVMDYYYQLVQAEKYLSQQDKKEVLKVIRDVKLDKFASALIWILSEYFGLVEECQLWKPNKEDGEFLLEEILRTGNFGQKDERRPDDLQVGGLKFFLYVQRRNLALSRFDHSDWFWGSLWRIYYFIWRKIHGFIR